MEVDAGDFSVGQPRRSDAGAHTQVRRGPLDRPFQGYLPGVCAHSARSGLSRPELRSHRRGRVLPPLPKLPVDRTRRQRPGAATRTIDSTQTRTGDRLVLCAPEEMQWRLKEFPSPAPRCLPHRIYRSAEARANSGQHSAVWFSERIAPFRNLPPRRFPSPGHRTSTPSSNRDQDRQSRQRVGWSAG
jgi:hypothetical protein